MSTPQHPFQESTLQVKPTSSRRNSQQPHFLVTADGDGIANHVGSAAIRELADRLGLTRALSKALAGMRRRSSAHDPGHVLRDLVVMLVDGGDCVADVGALRDQPDLFGKVASTPTAWRVLDAMTEADLPRLRDARRQAREESWRRGGAPSEIVLDFDATLVTAHSEKENAAPTFKRGFGFHPLTCYLDESGEALAAKLRAGNAGSNTVIDHVEVLEMAMEQLPESAWEMDILARADSSGATHGFLDALRAYEIRFSVGLDLTEPVREAVLAMPESAWRPALSQAGEEREGAGVCELTGLDLSTWPRRTRAICRRERPHPGAQLTFTDHQGYRFQVFITDQSDADIVALEVRHRAHARVEDRIRCAKDTGLSNFPFHDFLPNQVWLELVLAAQDLIAFFQRLCLVAEAQAWEPKKLRYRLLHTAARIVRSSRRLILKLQSNWRWTPQLYEAFRRMRALAAA